MTATLAKMTARDLYSLCDDEGILGLVPGVGDARQLRRAYRDTLRAWYAASDEERAAALAGLADE